MISRTRIAIVLAFVGLTAALTACGVASTVDPVAAAATKTEQAGGAKVAMTIEITDGTSQKSYSITANGEFDRDQGELTIAMAGLLQSAGVQAAGGDLKLLYLKEDGDAVVYLNFPPLASQLPGGKSWIRLDLQKAGKSLGVDLNQLLSASTQSPAQALDLLRASGQLDRVGAETIDGVATTEYKGTIDLAKAAALHGGAAQQLVEGLIAQGAPGELPVEAWIGDDGLVRRIRLTEELQTGGESLSVVVTLGMSDFGTDVSVSAPPADQVFDATAFAAMAAQALSGTTTNG